MGIHQSLTNDEVLEVVKSLTGTHCSELTQITGGLHHRVYRCKGTQGNNFIIKYYHTDEPTSEGNLINEFNSSGFMWDHDIRQIPKPVNADLERKIAVYSFVNGSKLNPGDVDEGKVTELTDFLTQLHSISKIQDAAETLPAGEAFFSLDQLFEVIDIKIETLKDYDTSNPYGFELKDFIESKLEKGLDTLKNDAVMIYESFELSSSDLIHYEWTTLNPSDLGFHNALLKNDGNVIFLDFESFGRDDPVKLVSDFLLNPESSLKKENYFAFLRKIIPVYQKDETTFKERLKSLFPIIAVKSALQILEEFEPEIFKNRMKNLGNEKESELLLKHLKKAEGLLDTSKERFINLNRWLKTI